MSPYKLLAILSYFLIVLGLAFRKNRRVHYRFMGSGIAIDITLVLVLQITREAVQTVVANKLTAIQMVHVTTSLLAVLIYLPIIYFGLKQLRGRGSPRGRQTHITLGILAFCARTVGFLTMFSMATST